MQKYNFLNAYSDNLLVPFPGELAPATQRWPAFRRACFERCQWVRRARRVASTHLVILVSVVAVLVAVQFRGVKSPFLFVDAHPFEPAGPPRFADAFRGHT